MVLYGGKLVPTVKNQNTSNVGDYKSYVHVLVYRRIIHKSYVGDTSYVWDTRSNVGDNKSHIGLNIS